MIALLLLAALAPAVLGTVEPAQAAGQATRQEQKKPHNPRRVHQLNDLKRVEVSVGDKKFMAWVMDNNSKIMEGMMHLKDAEVDADDAMIFVFPNDDWRGFWMENTLIPLDLVFVDSKGKIVNIAQGKPLDRTTIYSEGPAKYVIEFKAGTMKRHKIEPGMTFKIPELKSDYR